MKGRHGPGLTVTSGIRSIYSKSMPMSVTVSVPPNDTERVECLAYCSSRGLKGPVLVRDQVGRGITHAPEQRKVELQHR